MTQEKLAELTGRSQSAIARIERGTQSLAMEDAAAFAAALDTGELDILGVASTVPLRHFVGDGISTGPRIPVPADFRAPWECYGVQILDRSADRLHYMPGTYAVVRECDALDWKLAPGDRVDVRVRGGGGAPDKFYIGELTTTALGDVLVALRTTLREVPTTISVRSAEVDFREARSAYVPETIDVRPRPGDEAEILGRVEWVLGPAA